MKALSVQQPWASRIASGVKTVEVRTWATPHRGPLLICAALRPRSTDLPVGVALCMVELLDVCPMTPQDAPAAGVPDKPGCFAWVLGHVRAITPFPVSGRLGLFDVDLPAPQVPWVNRQASLYLDAGFI